MATRPTWFARNDLVRSAGSTSSKTTSSSACRDCMISSNLELKSDACDASWTRPSPRTRSLSPAALARASAAQPRGPATPTSAAAEAGSAVACRSPCSGDASSLPANTMTRMRATVRGSCSDERTSGKGSETPSSGSMSQAPSAPSTSTGSAPGLRGTSSPTTTGSSLCSRRTSSNCETLSLATTKIMPSPQLNVDANSEDWIFPTAPNQRKIAGNSHASARKTAAKCGGRTPLKQRARPPLATGTAPRRSPSLATARTGFT
mmetsp:Transcript_20732/g.58296  ORF Transcript_20732/g.58296 Transcript_20732/m.58296 type:complete len:262 (+) Transcript_20732:850-1635(+)